MNFSKIAFSLLAAVLIAGCASHPKTVEQQAATANFGPAPANASQVVKDFFGKTLYESASLQIMSVSQPYKAYAYDPAYIPKGQNFGWGIKTVINAKDRMGAYLGATQYAFFVRNGVVLNAYKIVPPQIADGYVRPLQ